MDCARRALHRSWLGALCLSALTVACAARSHERRPAEGDETPTPEAAAKDEDPVDSDARARPSEADADVGSELKVDAGFALLYGDDTCARRPVPADMMLRPTSFPLCGLGGGCGPFQCQRSEDCTLRPGGHCFAAQNKFCDYPDHSPFNARWCHEDADCDDEPDGHCVLMVLSSSCRYDECETDAECAQGKRCGCDGLAFACLPAECVNDRDCGSGQRCIAYGECGRGLGFRCTTPRDSCFSDADCVGQKLPNCARVSSSFACNTRCDLDF